MHLDVSMPLPLPSMGNLFHPSLPQSGYMPMQSAPVIPPAAQPYVDMSDAAGSRPRPVSVDPELRRAALSEAMDFRTRHASRESTTEYRWNSVLAGSAKAAQERDLLRRDEAVLGAAFPSSRSAVPTKTSAISAGGGPGSSGGKEHQSIHQTGIGGGGIGGIGISDGSVDTISTSRQHGNHISRQSANMKNALASHSSWMRGAADEFSSELRRKERPWTARG